MLRMSATGHTEGHERTLEGSWSKGRASMGRPRDQPTRTVRNLEGGIVMFDVQDTVNVHEGPSIGRAHLFVASRTNSSEWEFKRKTSHHDVNAGR